jgi:hypothetical protein
MFAIGPSLDLNPQNHALSGSRDRIQAHGVTGMPLSVPLESNSMDIDTTPTLSNALETNVDSESHLTPWEMAEPVLIMPLPVAAGIGLTGNCSLGICRQVDAYRCRLLAAERDAMLRSLNQVRESLLQQQVTQMEKEVEYEDHISRLVAINLVLKNNESSAINHHFICQSHLVSHCSSLERKRKRSRSLDDVTPMETKRRCL